jgi:hypothetical protein
MLDRFAWVSDTTENKFYRWVGNIQSAPAGDAAAGRGFSEWEYMNLWVASTPKPPEMFRSAIRLRV